MIQFDPIKTTTRYKLRINGSMKKIYDLETSFVIESKRTRENSTGE